VKKSGVGALGAKIYRTPAQPNGMIRQSSFFSQKMEKELPNAHILINTRLIPTQMHINKFTAQEILDDVGEGLAMVVMGVGTGGTITGVANG